MSLTLVGKKLGMTRVFDDNGVCHATTILSLFDLIVVGIRTVKKNGYNAIVVGYEVVSEKKLNKPQVSYFKKHGLPMLRKQFEVSVIDIDKYEIGQKIAFDDLKNASKVTVVGKSIGKGFAGAMKRHNFGGLRASHGVSISHRSHGSTGACQDPGKVFKGKKMAGHLGNAQVTTKNLSLYRYDEKRGFLFIIGSVPGAKNSHVKVNY